MPRNWAEARGKVSTTSPRGGFHYHEIRTYVEISLKIARKSRGFSPNCATQAKLPQHPAATVAPPRKDFARLPERHRKLHAKPMALRRELVVLLCDRVAASRRVRTADGKILVR